MKNLEQQNQQQQRSFSDQLDQESDESDNRQSGSFQRRLRKSIKKQPFRPNPTIGERIRDLFKKGDYKDIVSLAQGQKYNYQEYDEMKVNKQVLKVGQNTLIKNANNADEDYIGKIMRILSIKEEKSNKLICLCEVKWYFRKSEIVRVRPQCRNWISQNEVFSTDCTDYILASAIYSVCRIITLEEYESYGHIDKTTYFTRIGWIPLKEKFDGFAKLKQSCTCKQPLNPDLAYIMCDRCNEWYHMQCVGVKKGEYDNKQYICGACR